MGSSHIRLLDQHAEIGILNKQIRALKSENEASLHWVNNLQEREENSFIPVL
jgi:hypothetical protein